MFICWIVFASGNINDSIFTSWRWISNGRITEGLHWIWRQLLKVYERSRIYILNAVEWLMTSIGCVFDQYKSYSSLTPSRAYVISSVNLQVSLGFINQIGKIPQLLSTNWNHQSIILQCIPNVSEISLFKSSFTFSEAKIYIQISIY